ncbi:hypothetical protein [Streptomyces gossypiisoli]|uniref:hypothetical protein n=1 Tax=Streptomyces gossypiisoli TaxID=2748864 RepID=UPI001E646E10|nr:MULTISPECIES: hypothetical protein [Streptomyces]
MPNNSCHQEVVEHGKNVGIDVEIVERNPDDKGFVPQAKRVDRGADERDPDVLPPSRTRLTNTAPPPPAPASCGR